MGQYKQWLQYQEIDGHLRNQVEMLEDELAQLEEHLHCLEQKQQETPSLTDNPIIQALLVNLQINNTSPASELPSSDSGDSISPMLLSWGELSNFEPHEIKEPLSVSGQAQAFTSHPEINISPDDMVTCFDEYSQTDPQLELPWWLRKITVSSQENQESRPIDQNSIRTNRLVQRWIERWGRQPSTTFEPTEKEEESARE